MKNYIDGFILGLDKIMKYVAIPGFLLLAIYLIITAAFFDKFAVWFILLLLYIFNACNYMTSPIRWSTK